MVEGGKGGKERTFERRIASLGFFFAASVVSGARSSSVKNAG
jgi:hypothetical protein